MHDLIGRVLQDRYRIESLLGRGGMAEVYKAWDTWRNYHVAIKVMREDLAEDLEFVRRFKREAQALAALSHANIVRFYSFERDDLVAFIVMDYVDGTTLRSEIARADGPLPLEQVLAVAEQVCSALHYAHLEGVIHRDVKPGNILLLPDGQVMVTDFGIAKAADAATVTTVVPGTPAYMSPEQCRGEPLDARSDVYSLGVVVYEMLAGRRPFVGESEAAGTGSTAERIRWEQVQAAPPPPRQLNPALSKEVEAVVLKALAKEREGRWPSAIALWEALKATCGCEMGSRVARPALHSDRPAIATPASPARPPVSPAPIPASRLTRLAPVYWALGGLVLVILLVVLWRLVIGQPHDSVPHPTRRWLLVCRRPRRCLCQRPLSHRHLSPRRLQSQPSAI